jgi:acyl-CoA thioester hydrolase
MPLEGFPVVVQLPVLWSDQDLYGHVNNVVYLRWFECSRVAYWDSTGMRDVMKGAHRGPILAAVHCNFRQQLNYPDRIHVGARMRSLGKTSMKMEHQIYSESQDIVVADGESVIVLFNYDQQRKDVIFSELQAVIERAEGRSL